MWPRAPAPRDDAADEFTVTLAGPGLTSLSANLEYIGGGAYRATQLFFGSLLAVVLFPAVIVVLIIVPVLLCCLR